jgi:hypothetical protein
MARRSFVMANMKTNQWPQSNTCSLSAYQFFLLNFSAILRLNGNGNAKTHVAPAHARTLDLAIFLNSLLLAAKFDNDR